MAAIRNKPCMKVKFNGSQLICLPYDDQNVIYIRLRVLHSL